MAERVVKTRLTVQVADWEKGWIRAAAAVNATGTELEKLEQKKQAFEQVGRGLVLTGTALTAITALSVKAASDWESAWAGVTKTVEGTPEQLAEVESGLRGLTSVLPATHDEIAAVAEAAGQLGIETPNVVEFTRTMIDLGETTNLSANDAATALARFVNIMGTSEDEVDNLGSALVGLGNNYATTESEILEMSMRLAGAGKQIGLSEGDVLGLATALSSVGIEAEAGGSAMSKVMIDIAASVEEGGERLEMFAQTAGVSADQFAEKWKSDPAAALSLFVKGLSNAEAQGKSTIGVLGELGITEVRMRDALLRSSAAADQFSTAMADGNTAFDENNALTLEAAKRYETVESKVQIAGNAVRDAAIDFGEVFLPAVAGAAEGVTQFAGFMGDLPDPVQGLLGILGGVAGAIALTGGSALLAVPKLAEFKVALQTLQTSFGKVAWIGGGIVAALTTVIAVVGAVSAAQAEARAKAEAYADTLAEGTHRITDATRDLIAENINAKESFLGLDYSSMADNAKKLGISLDTVRAAIEGDAEAIAELDRVTQDAIDGYNFFSDEAIGLSSAAHGLRDEVEAETGSLKDAAEAARRKAEATGEAAVAADTAADAYMSEADAVAELSGTLSGLIDRINEANGVNQDAVSANARYQSALAGISDEVQRQRDEYERANGGLSGFVLSLDQATASGSANAASLTDVAKAAQDAAAAQFEQDQATMSADDATSKYLDTLAAQRQAFIDSAIEAGYNADEVNALADSVFAMPDAKEVKIIAETAEAQTRLDDFVLNNNGRTIRVKVATDGTQSWDLGGRTVSAEPNASGGFYDMGVKEFASGGFEPGIYPATPGGIHKFAEAGHAEMYASTDPQYADKSYGVWTTYGNRMGFTSDGQSSHTPTPVEVRVIAQPKGGIDFMQYVEFRVDEVKSDLGSGLRGI